MSLWLWPLQRLINDALHYDAQAQTRLLKLAGHSIVLATREPDLTLALFIDAGTGSEAVQVTLSTEIPVNPDARVSGKARDLFSVLRADDRAQAMMVHQIDIQGDTRTFFTLQEVMSTLDIDWEMALGDRLGDLPAHFVADGLRLFGGMAKAQGQSFDRTVRNFLREESDWLVPNSLWREHAQTVHQTRMAVDRLGARIARLRQQVDTNADRRGQS
ncbi:ubiquinone biosynthesis accessory factor UbiJ [Saccharospirillum impatiens]|uniref:ubiquinone biosynthesis accessory factor UbiJ n=1 Tax=Saccharospirillum impatiens TaxID=169438 RepID=UPI0003F677AE|nr:SCP2 sterol-binding domain-containing protein [Saccharospirillum impatiens]